MVSEESLWTDVEHFLPTEPKVTVEGVVSEPIHDKIGFP